MMGNLPYSAVDAIAGGTKTNIDTDRLTYILQTPSSNTLQIVLCDIVIIIFNEAVPSLELTRHLISMRDAAKFLINTKIIYYNTTYPTHTHSLLPSLLSVHIPNSPL